MSERRWRVRGASLPVRPRALVMGILNVTPDSFSDGGRYHSPEAAFEHAQAMVAEGADIIDVGAESTRPGAVLVDAEEEIRRLEPILPRLVQELPVPISVDTWKAKVAAYALDVGAHIINDVWGLQGDPAMAETLAAYEAGVVLMHNSRQSFYPEGVRASVLAFLKESVRRAEAAGIERERLVVDPGIGFGKEPEQSYQVMAGLRDLSVLGLPILVGPSRKRFLGAVTGRPVGERLHATVAAVTAAVLAGAAVVRVHDVAPAVDACRVAEAILAADEGTSECTVGVRNLAFAARHGAYAEERLVPQPFYVDVVARYDRSGQGDDIHRALDYTVLAEAARDVMAGPRHNLLETLAEEILMAVRERLPQATYVLVEIRKPKARLLAPAEGSFARVEWRR